jgi:hypothetical protein
VLDEFHGKNMAAIVKHIIHTRFNSLKIHELHASQMSFADKVHTFNYFLKENFKLSYLVIDKNNIDKNMFKNTNICFNYMVQLMLKDLILHVDTLKLFITVDNRNVKITSEKALEEYLNIELLKNEIYDKYVHVRYEDSRQHHNLQAVDLFTNAIYAKYNYNKSHFYSLFVEKVYGRVNFPLKIDNNLKFK